MIFSIGPTILHPPSSILHPPPSTLHPAGRGELAEHAARGVELGAAAVELVEPVAIGARVQSQDLQDAELAGVGVVGHLGEEELPAMIAEHGDISDPVDLRVAP